MGVKTLPVVDMTSVRRLLIVKMSALGDVLHALPVSAALGEAYPHLEITWVVEEPFVPLLSGNPTLTEVYAIPKLRAGRLRDAEFRRAYFGRLRGLRQRQFDLVLDLQGLTKSAIVAVLSGAKLRLGYHWLREIASLLEYRIPHDPASVHIVDQYLDVARYLGANPNTVRFPFHIPDEAESSVVAMLCEAGLNPDAPFLAVNPASAKANKQWDTERFALLLDTAQEKLGLPGVLVTTDKPVAEAVQNAAKRPFVNLAGRTDLKQLAAVLRRSAVHICGDTGSAHLAAALGRPVITLVGPTDPDRIGPYGQRDNVIAHREVCDAACTWHHCRFASPRCLAAITVEEVVSRIRTVL